MKLLLFCLAIGIAISLLAVGGTELAGDNNPFHLIGVGLLLPSYIVTFFVDGRNEWAGSDYTLMIWFGSVFYGMLAYFIALIVQRISKT